MPSFDTAEKEHLRNKLMLVGRKAFVNHGLKRTSLEQMTQAIGVAKSTFYAFFDSKEELYLHLLEEEAGEIEQRVWAAVGDAAHVQEALTAYMRAMSHELDSGSLTRRLIDHPEELELVARKVSPEFVQRKLERNVKPLLEFIAKQQQAGMLIEGDPEVIVGVIRAALLVVVHRRDFDGSRFAQVKEMMFQAVAASLVPHNK